MSGEKGHMRCAGFIRLFIWWVGGTRGWQQGWLLGGWTAADLPYASCFRAARRLRPAS
jgi:hypothetical protein